MKISTLVILCVIILIVLSGSAYYYLNYVVSGNSNKAAVDITPTTEKRILAFGDSLTYGYGLATVDDSYPSQLQNKLTENEYNYKVINFGISGETTGDALLRLPAALSYTPDIVLLEFGANDFLQSKSPEEAQENLEKIIKSFDDKNIKVILLNVEQNPLLPLPNKDRFSQIMPDLAKKYGLQIVTSFLDGILLNPNLTIEDRVHPNKIGYAKALSDNLWPILKKELVK